MRLELFQTLTLGIIQGLGEFLPISSSAHLVLAPWLLGWPYFGLAFDVALHVGTLFAVIAYFWRDWLLLLGDGLRFKQTVESRLFWLLVVATIPGATAGYFLEHLAETAFRHPLLVAVMLMAMGIILYWADKKSPAMVELRDINWKEGLLIGVSQALAIIPGVSRSGITMTTGRLMGLTRETSARFSFLLSTPIIAGAGVKEFTTLEPGDLNLVFLSGILISGLVGFGAIKFLINYLARRDYSIFVWYRLALGLLVVGVYFYRVV